MTVSLVPTKISTSEVSSSVILMSLLPGFILGGVKPTAMNRKGMFKLPGDWEMEGRGKSTLCVIHTV